jgi:hypothetical protein
MRRRAGRFTRLFLEALEERTLLSNIPAILLLDPSARGALNVMGNGGLQATGGGIVVVDSNNPQGALAAGRGSVSAGEFDFSGNPGFAGTFHGVIHSGVAPSADPLAGLPVPQAPATTFAAVDYSDSALLTLAPGTYVGGIKVSGHGSLQLMPGIYYLDGGGLSVDGQASLTGDGVMIYNHPHAGGDGIRSAGNGTMHLTPPTSGTYQDITIFQDRTSSVPIDLAGNGDISITGTVYAPRAMLNAAGNGGLASPGNPSAINEYIVYDLNSTGRGDIQADASFNQPLTLTIALSPDPMHLPDGSLLTSAAQVTLTGTTRPGATVDLETGSDGLFDEGHTTADASGHFSLPVTLAAGANRLQVRSTSRFDQQATASIQVTLATAVRIAEISPANGEEQVDVARTVIVRFDRPIDPTTVTTGSFYLIANGQNVPGTVRVSSTNQFATFIPTNPLPPSTEVRVVVDGNQIKDPQGMRIDAAGAGTPGGQAIADFRTLPLTRIAGTNIFGYVYDAYNRRPDGSNIPVVGATIRVDAFPAANAVTDANGYFILRDMPAPGFFVHVDGTTATTAPPGTMYPSVGKELHDVPGQTVQLNMSGTPFNIYLPPMATGDIRPLSATKSTDVGFGAGGMTELQTMFPTIDPAVWSRVKVTFAANSAQDRTGAPATQAAIIPVPPDRLPAPLPPQANPRLVISIQAMGATSFDVPAPVTFPNLEGLLPGQKSLIWSFNHDKGAWEVVGTGTVSTDGLMIVSDGGVIKAPGWHFTNPGDPGNAPPPKKPPQKDWGDIKKCLQDNYDREQGGSGAALAHQLLCLAQMACGAPWGQGWIKNLLGDIANNVQNPDGSSFNPLDPTGIDQAILDHLPPDISLGTIPGLGISTGDLGAALGGFGHFVNELLPGFIHNAPHLHDVVDPTKPYQPDRSQPNYNPYQHDAFFDQAVVPCFDQVYQAGEISFLGKLIAQQVVPIAAAALRELVWNAYQLVIGRGGRSLAPAPAITVTRDQLFSTQLDAASTLKVTAVGNPYFLPVGMTVQLQVSKTNPDGTVTDLTASPATEFFAIDGENLTGLTRDGRLTIRATDTPFAGLPSLLYVLVKNGSDYGIGQFAITDVDTTGDGISASYVPRLGIPAADRGNAQAAQTDLLETFRGPQPGSTPSNTQVYYVLQDLSTGFVQRGKTNTDGSLRGVVLNPNTRYRETVVQQGTLFTGSVSFTTPAGGVPVTLPAVALRPSIYPDTIGNGLPDDAKFVLGTDPNRFSTAGDGISDGAKFAQGLDLFDGRGFPTGVISTLPLQGTAEKVLPDGNKLYVATGSYGLAIVDGTQFNNPIVLGQLRLAGNATDVGVDSNLQIAAVAAGSTLYLVNVSDPMTPTITRSVAVSATRVVVANGIAYAVAGNMLKEVDLLTGEILQSLTLPGSGNVTGLARDGTKLYAYERNSGTFMVIDISNEGLAAVQGQLFVSIASADVGVFAGNGVAWLAGSGLTTVNVSDPTHPTLIHGADVTFTARRIALNGSGLGVLAPDGNNFVEVYDTGNPNVTANRLLQIPLSGGARNVAISRGIAYVADGAGLEVVNYLSFDTRGIPPSITISTSVPSVDIHSLTVFEGTTVPVRADASDDVQVRDVQLLVNGQMVRDAVSFPFDFFAIAPTIALSGNSFTIQALATDTGGNTMLSNVITIGLVRDTSPPTISSIDPANGTSGLEGPQTVCVRFSKSLAAATVTTANFQLQDASGNTIIPTNFQLRDNDRVVELTYAGLAAGNYQFVVHGSGVTDRAGNPLGTTNVVSAFTLTPRTTLTVANAPGNQVLEGTTLHGAITVATGVTVQTVALIVNGQVVSTGSSVPFNFSTIAPLLSSGTTTVTLQARVTDTSGFVTTTPPLVITLLRDTTPPTIVGTDPPNGGTRDQGLSTVTITFSKSIATSSATTNNFHIFKAGPSGVLGGPDQIAIPIAGLQFLADDTQIQLTTAPLQYGLYQLVVTQDGITDRPGNPLGTGTFNSTFTLVPQLVQNGGFETGDLTGWIFTGAGVGSDFFVGPTPTFGAHTGSYAANFGAVATSFDSIAQTLPTIPGHSYVLSYWLSHNDTNLENEFQVSWGGNIIQDLLNVSSFNWTNYTFTELATNSSTVLQFSGYEIPAWFGLDDVSVLDNGQPQFVAAIPKSVGESANLTQEQLQPVVSQAIANLGAAGFNVSGLRQVDFRLASLPGSLLGLTYQNTIWIDQSAQGYGWYVDVSPSSNGSFTQVTGANEVQAVPGSPAYGHVDLLTVVTHELGHVLGFASIDASILDHDWMTATLGTGVRRYPDAANENVPYQSRVGEIPLPAAPLPSSQHLGSLSQNDHWPFLLGEEAATAATGLASSNLTTPNLGTAAANADWFRSSEQAFASGDWSGNGIPQPLVLGEPSGMSKLDLANRQPGQNPLFDRGLLVGDAFDDFGQGLSA